MQMESKILSKNKQTKANAYTIAVCQSLKGKITAERWLYSFNMMQIIGMGKKPILRETEVELSKKDLQ